jgi:hypothetical protein
MSRLLARDPLPKICQNQLHHWWPIQVPLCSRSGSMEIKIGEQIDAGANFMLGQIFVFGSIAFYIDSAGHLGQVGNSTPGWIVKFDNLENTTDFHGKQAFTSWVSDQMKENHDALIPKPSLNLAHDGCMNPSPGPTLRHDPITSPDSQTIDLAHRKGPRSMSDRILRKLPPTSMSDRAQGKCEKNLPSWMPDQA